MKTECDPSKLSFHVLTDDAKLAAATEELLAAEQVALKVVAMPKSQAAQKTVARFFAKDRLNPRPRAPKPYRDTRRGGRIWRITQRGSVYRPVKVGDVCVIPKDFGLMRALPSISRFVEVAPA